MNIIPFILLTLYALLIIAAGIGVGGSVLYWLSKKWKIAQATLKQSFSIVLVGVVAGLALLVIFYFVKGDVLRGIISFIVSLSLYTILIWMFYRPPIVRSLGLAFSFIIIGGVANFLLSVIFVLPVRLFFIQPLTIKGAAMEPTYHEGDYVLVQKIQRSFHRGDVVVFFYQPNDQKKRILIKRIIGLPGEAFEIKGGEAYINGTTIELPSVTALLRDSPSIVLKDDEYFVVGDNASISFDSQVFGPISATSIIGSPITQTEIFQKFFK